MGYYEEKRERILRKIFRISLIPWIGVIIVLFLSPLLLVELMTFAEYSWMKFEACIRFLLFLIEKGILPVCIIYQIFYVIRCFIKEIK